MTLSKDNYPSLPKSCRDETPACMGTNTQLSLSMAAKLFLGWKRWMDKFWLNIYLRAKSKGKGYKLHKTSEMGQENSSHSSNELGFSMTSPSESLPNHQSQLGFLGRWRISSISPRDQDPAGPNEWLVMSEKPLGTPAGSFPSIHVYGQKVWIASSPFQKQYLKFHSAPNGWFRCTLMWSKRLCKFRTTSHAKTFARYHGLAGVVLLTQVQHLL